MKKLIIFFLLPVSASLYAQNSDPAISLSPVISTTVTNQPQSMPNSNKNPTTGTVIGLKQHKNAKSDKSIIVSDTLTLLNKSNNKATQQKKTHRKHKTK